MALDLARPFILFDDARADLHCRVYQGEVARIAASDFGEVRGALERLRAAHTDGLHAAGYIAYEAGGGLEMRMRGRLPADRALLSFGLYERAEFVPWREITAAITGRTGKAYGFLPPASAADHENMVAACLKYILDGDVYQINATLVLEGRAAGHPAALYDRLRRAQRMPYGALAKEAGGRWVLSASPEMFFELKEGNIAARPMKGTAARQPSAAKDAAAAETLSRDEKNRAENLMITDLIRNDLSRIAKPGTVSVEDMFRVETYPTVHQMVTGLSAELADGMDAVDVLAAMFPCGSITGAPKIRAVQIITEVEPAARGLYTGSIGYLDPSGDAAFNVAIRTLEVVGDRIKLGVGAGIVADSDPQEEWHETMAKAAFAEADAHPFHLFETMRFDPDEGIKSLELHLARLKASSARFDFACNRHAIRNYLQALTGRETETKRIKLTLARGGQFSASLAPISETPAAMQVAIVPLPVPPDDWRLFHKTSDRAFYDETRRDAGSDEVMFRRKDGLLTEGSFTNLFVKRENVLLTPRAESGLLPGVLRADLLQTGRAREADLRARDLSDGFFIGNALRGLIPATLVAPQNAGS